jgi:hypothetical protein
MMDVSRELNAAIGRKLREANCRFDAEISRLRGEKIMTPAESFGAYLRSLSDSINALFGGIARGWNGVGK